LLKVFKNEVPTKPEEPVRKILMYNSELTLPSIY